MATFMAVTGLIALLTGVVLVVGRLRVAWGFSHANATIIGADSARVDRTIGRITESRRVYFLRYRFQDAAGVSHEFTNSASTPMFLPDMVGLVQKVRYHPVNPQHAVIWDPWAMFFVPLTCLLCGLCSLGAAYWFW